MSFFGIIFFFFNEKITSLKLKKKPNKQQTHTQRSTSIQTQWYAVPSQEHTLSTLDLFHYILQIGQGHVLPCCTPCSGDKLSNYKKTQGDQWFLDTDDLNYHSLPSPGGLGQQWEHLIQRWPERAPFLCLGWFHSPAQWFLFPNLNNGQARAYIEQQWAPHHCSL